MKTPRWCRRAVRDVVHLALVAGLLVGSTIAFVPTVGFAQPRDAGDLLDARARLALLFQPLLDTRQQLDGTTFDIDDLAFEVAFEEAPTIVAAVHRLVRYEPYVGLLRGAEGTLAGGGGNALDQALLTSFLLASVGYEVEIHGAALDDDQARRLVETMRTDTPPALEALDVRLDIEPIVQDMVDATDDVTDALFDVMEADVERVTAVLADAVQVSAGNDASLLAAAASYHWVAYRWHDGEPWSEAHPVFGTVDRPEGFPDADTTIDGEVPEELLHRVRFQAFVERRLGDEIVVTAVMEPWERPTALVYGRTVTYANVPDGLAVVDDPGDTAALAAATSYFFPMIDGDMPNGAQAFDMLGTTVPPAAAQSVFGPVFQSLGTAAAEGFGALRGIGVGGRDAAEPAADAISLTAQWIDITVVAPGGEETVHRRMITDRRGAEARSQGVVTLDPEVSQADAFEALTRTHTLLVAGGAVGPGYVLDRSLDAIEQARDFADEALRAAFEQRDVVLDDFDRSRAEARMAALLYLAALDDVPLDPDVVTYRPGPAVIVLSQAMDGSASLVDVVTNPRTSVTVRSDGPRLDPSATLRAGVWETRSEGIVVRSASAQIIPAFAAFASDTATPRLLPDEASVDSSGLPWPRETLDAIREDLGRGYLVVVPADPSPDHVGWWRVDPASGETLGRAFDGRGGAFTEEAMLTLSISVNIAFTLFGAYQCDQIDDLEQAGCCHVQNISIAIVGMVAGAIAGLKYAAGKVFWAGDVGGNLGAQFLDFCS